jgi:hypothetical protein
MKTNASEGMFNINLSSETPPNKINEDVSDYILPRRPLHFERPTQRMKIEPETTVL